MTTPLMTLTLPTVGPGGTQGPNWATELNAALTVIDGHDHSSGNGARITPAGLNINAALEMNDYRIYELGAAVLTSQSAILTGASYLNSLQVVSGELHYRDASGNDVQLTASGALNASSIGGIGGDYATSTAAVTYSDTTKAYSFTQSSGVTGDLVAGSLFVYENASGANYVKLASKASLAANVSLELPSSVPSSVTEVMTMTTGGVMGSTATPTVTTLTTTGDVIAGSDVQTDSLIEKTSNTGVTADGVLNKDSTVEADNLLAESGFVNGGARVAGAVAGTLSTSWAHTTLPCWRGKVTGTLGAGTMAQASSISGFRTGKAAHLSGVTLSGGSDTAHIKILMEGLNAEVFQDQTVSVQVKVRHDKGSAVDVNVYLRDADVLDTFSATSAVGSTLATSVATGTTTTIKIEGIDLTSHNPERGLELEIEFECGAVTTKNFYAGEAQINIGSRAVPFAWSKTYRQEAEECLRYWEAKGGVADQCFGAGVLYSSGSAAEALFDFSKKHHTPTMSVSAYGDFQADRSGATVRNFTAFAFKDTGEDVATGGGALDGSAGTAGDAAFIIDDSNGNARIYSDARLS